MHYFVIFIFMYISTCFRPTVYHKESSYCIHSKWYL